MKFLRKITLSFTLSLTMTLSAFDGSFETSGTKLIDACGNEFVMRGANYSWCWQRGKESTVIPAAKRIGCNTLRIQLGTGKRYHRPTTEELSHIISLCEDNRLVIVLNTHDATGSNDYDDLEDSVLFWIDMADILNAHTATTIINITNEWYGGWGNASSWAEGYIKAIKAIREADIRNTLIVDAAGWGQWPESIFQKGAEVADSDPLKNTMFSIHLYDVAGKNHSTVKKNIDNALATGYPVIVGEFAYQHGGKTVDWQSILNYTTEKKVGYLVWSWTGNSGGVEDCDMFGGFDESDYKPNGLNTVLGRNGIRDTSEECTVYSMEAGLETQGGNQRCFDFSSPYEIFTIDGCQVTKMEKNHIYILKQGITLLKIKH
ncbi:MAG: glycoside hydrolase family 5 protein [Duncaniella sp.]|nr:glycoside hydrolase family 5 protein [Duncaniella sp.]